MRGKTPEEVAALTQNLYDYTQQMSAQPAPQQQYTSPNVESQMSGGMPDPNLMYSNPAEYQRQLMAFQNAQWQAQMNAYAQPVLQQNAETARELSKRGDYAKVWEKWEPEIELELRGIPLHQRTRQMYDSAAKIVRGNHVEELARERAEALATQFGSGTERAHNVGNAAPAAFDKLDEIYDTEHPFFVKAREERVTKDMIRDHCRMMKISVDEYVRNATLGSVILSKNGFERRSA